VRTIPIKTAAATGTARIGVIPICPAASAIAANSVTNVRKFTIMRSANEKRPHQVPKRQ
jgi:hypothetical protein